MFTAIRGVGCFFASIIRSPIRCVAWSSRALLQEHRIIVISKWVRLLGSMWIHDRDLKIGLSSSKTFFLMGFFVVEHLP